MNSSLPYGNNLRTVELMRLGEAGWERVPIATDVAYGNGVTSWAPDGHTFVYSTEETDEDGLVWSHWLRHLVDGRWSEPTLLGKATPRGYSTEWSDDGGTLAFTLHLGGERNESFRTFLVNLDSGVNVVDVGFATSSLSRSGTHMLLDSLADRSAGKLTMVSLRDRSLAPVWSATWTGDGYAGGEISPDGTLVALGCGDRALRIADVYSGEVSHVVPAPANVLVRPLSWAPSQSYLLYNAVDTKTYVDHDFVYDVQHRRTVAVGDPASNRARYTWLPGPRPLLLAEHRPRSSVLLDLEDSANPRRLELPTDTFELEASPNGRFAALRSSSQLSLVDLRKFTTTPLQLLEDVSSSHVSLSDDGTRALLVEQTDEQQSVTLLDTETATPLSTVSGPVPTGGHGVHFEPGTHRWLQSTAKGMTLHDADGAEPVLLPADVQQVEWSSR